jgi:hypothetical protein
VCVVRPPRRTGYPIGRGSWVGRRQRDRSNCSVIERPIFASNSGGNWTYPAFFFCPVFCFLPHKDISGRDDRAQIFLVQRASRDVSFFRGSIPKPFRRTCGILPRALITAALTLHA